MILPESELKMCSLFLWQNTALCGALLFFIEMKYLISRKQIRRKTPKAKTV